MEVYGALAVLGTRDPSIGNQDRGSSLPSSYGRRPCAILAPACAEAHFPVGDVQPLARDS